MTPWQNTLKKVMALGPKSKLTSQRREPRTYSNVRGQDGELGPPGLAQEFGRQAKVIDQPESGTRIGSTTLVPAPWSDHHWGAQLAPEISNNPRIINVLRFTGTCNRASHVQI